VHRKAHLTADKSENTDADKEVQKMQIMTAAE
jgi:hypothetical protein